MPVPAGGDRQSPFLYDPEGLTLEQSWFDHAIAGAAVMGDAYSGTPPRQPVPQLQLAAGPGSEEDWQNGDFFRSGDPDSGPNTNVDAGTDDDCEPMVFDMDLDD